MIEQYAVSLLINKSDLMDLAQRTDPDDTMSFYLDAVSDLLVVQAAFDLLANKYQKRINVYLFSGLNQTEMATLLDTKQSNVKRNFLRAIVKLMQIINN